MTVRWLGHGCAVSWDLNNGNCEKVYTEIFPSYEVKPIKAKIFDDLNLDMMKFSEDIDFATIEIKKLIDKYIVWLENEKLKTNDLDQEFKEVSKSNIKKAKDNLDRINEGLEILKTDKTIQDNCQESSILKTNLLIKSVVKIEKPIPLK